MANHGNGSISGRKLNSKRRKRLTHAGDGEHEDDFYRPHITEEHYRSMLGEHIQKFKRRSKDPHVGPAHLRGGILAPKSNVSSYRSRKVGDDQRGGFYDKETTPELTANISPQRPANYHDEHITPKISYEPSYLNIGDGVIYKIPPSYDKLAASLNLPSFSDIHVEEFYLKGTLDLGSLAELMASDKRSRPKSCDGMGDPRPQYESLQAKLKAMSASNSIPNFSLKVSEAAMNSAIPEGAAGSIARSILSEGGVLQVYYVKVLEKGDTYEVWFFWQISYGKLCHFVSCMARAVIYYLLSTFISWKQIIERSLPEKQKVKNDAAVIEKAEREKITKAWISIVRRDIPKHHRIFSTFHRKQSIDAKRFAENCQREVLVIGITSIMALHAVVKGTPKAP